MKADLHVDPEDGAAIERAIGDAASPVGIDAKKTHVIILQKLIGLERRLDRLEQRLTGD